MSKIFFSEKNGINSTFLSPQNLCKHCIDECDYIKYNKNIERQDRILTGITYINYIKNIQKGKCFGLKALCELILDSNNTFKDLSLKNAVKSMGHDTNTFRNVLKQFRDVIIVHLRFMQPSVDIISMKYTIMDKFANFGGNFGIYAEITGVSFLGLLNIFVLMLKIMFCCRRP